MHKSIPAKYLRAAMLALLCQAGIASAAVTFIGEGSIPGNAIDQSGLTGLLEDGVTPHNQAGGFGSGVAPSAGPRSGTA